jgi:PAS domain S-box-containing protein
MHNLPEVEDSKKSLRFATFQTLGISLLVLIGIVFFSNWWMKNTIDTKRTETEGFLVQIMTLVRNSIEPDLILYRNGSLSREETIKTISAKLRNMTYKDMHGLNYIFIVNYDGYILVQPYQPWLENTDQWDMQDENGVYLIRELLKNARSNPKGGFSTYFYKPPNLDIPEEKLSYAIDIPELEIIIGTGMYMRLYYQDQTITIQRVMLLTLLLALVILIITLSALRRISITGSRLEKEIIKNNVFQQKLVDSELNLRTIFNSMSDALFIQDSNGKIVEVNDRALEMFCCTKDEIIGNNIKNISASSEYDEESLRKKLVEAIKGETQVFEYRAKHLNGPYEFYVEVALRPVFWYGENLSLAVVRDIQGRKFIERELVHSQMINEHAEELGLFGHYSIDLDTQETKWSKGLYRLFKRDISLPAPDFDEYYSIIVAEDVERVRNLRLESYKKNQSYSVDYQIRRSDGETRDLSVKVNWLAEGNNPKRYLIGSIQDITEKNKAINIIKESEEKYRSIVQQMSDGLLLIDENGIVIEWNSAFEQITEIPSDKTLGKPIWDILPLLGTDISTSLKIKKMQKEINRSVKTGKSYIFNEPMEIAIRTLSGKERILRQSIFPILTTTEYRLGVIAHDITDGKAAMARINHELKKLASLRSIDAAILERVTPNETLKLISSIAMEQLDVDGAIILSRMAKDEISCAFVSRVDTKEEPTVERLLELQTAALEKFTTRKLTVDDLEILNQIRQLDPSTGMILNQAILPLFMNKRICGYIQVLSRSPLPEDQGWMDYYQTLAGQTSLAIENVTLITNEEVAYQELNKAYEATIGGWSKALELRDEETKGHSDRVMSLACRLAQKANFPHEKITDFRRGVLLHDIGKMGIPDRILLKPGPLNDEEWVIMRQHPVMAYDLLKTIPYLHDSLDVPYLHHERWDGSGYPCGLAGKDIPLAARIFAIVDVWDALISDRPYRKGWEIGKIRQYLSENKGIMFDPELVDMFLEIMNDYRPGQELEQEGDDCGY